MLARSIIGSPQTVRAGLDALVAETGADERIITLDVYDDAARLRSFELIAENRDGGADAVVAGIETVGARDEG
jgi:alkanesulfonate monooxygenase SsuD/methylene tetrahydromethanopterin reductase-like flavin-dependent oxidoreductase (luciferase family)